MGKGKARKTKVRPGSPERVLRAAEERVAEERAAKERAAENEYQMTEQDFIETMRRALSVPPMPPLRAKKAGVKAQMRVAKE